MENRQVKSKGLGLRILFGLCALIILPAVGLFIGTLRGSDGLLLGLTLGCMVGGALFLLLMWNLVKSKEAAILLGGYGVLGFLVTCLKLAGIDSKISWMTFLFYYFAVPLRLITSVPLPLHDRKNQECSADHLANNAADKSQKLDEDRERAEAVSVSAQIVPVRGRKKLIILLALLPLFILFFAGLYVGLSHDQGAVNQQQAQELYRDLHPTYTIAGITFEKEREWETLNSGEGLSAAINPTQGLFCTTDKKVLYGLLGTTALAGRSPEEFFAGMKAYYEESNEIWEADAVPEPWTAPDGTTCFVGTIKMIDNRQIYFLVTILIAPEKDLAATFYGQSKAEDCQQVNMDKMWQTAIFSSSE